MTDDQIRKRLDRLEQLMEAGTKTSDESRTPRNARVLEASSSTFKWATEFARTYDEHWSEEGRQSPYEHFPKYEYLRDVFDLVEMEEERIMFWEKSRDMMLSWALVAYFTLQAMKVPLRGILFQTQKLDKVVQLIDYAKCLYRTQPRFLRDAFPLIKPLEKQAKIELRFANGSYIVGIPGGANQIRSYHPWGYLMDEASFVVDAGECYNEAVAVVKGKIILNSSAGPGWYADVRHDIVRTEES